MNKTIVTLKFSGACCGTDLKVTMAKFGQQLLEMFLNKLLLQGIS